MSVIGYIGVFFGIIIVGLLATLYFVGIPAEWKRSMEERLAEQAAENKAASLLKDQVGKIPEADRDKAEKVSGALGSLTGGDLNNPLGKLRKGY